MLDDVEAKIDVNSFVSPIEYEVTIIVVVKTEVDLATVRADVDTKVTVVYCVVVVSDQGNKVVIEDDNSAVVNADVDVDSRYIVTVVFCVVAVIGEGNNVVVEDDISTVGNVDTDTQTDHFILEQYTKVPSTGLSYSTFIYNFFYA